MSVVINEMEVVVEAPQPGEAPPPAPPVPVRPRDLEAVRERLLLRQARVTAH